MDRTLVIIGTHIIGVVSVVVIDQGVSIHTPAKELRGSGCYQLQTSLAVAGIAICTVIHTDICLGVAVHEVQVGTTDLTGHFFQIEVCCLGNICTDCQTIIDISGRAGQVHDRTVGHLHTQLISSSIYRLGNQCSSACRLTGLGITGFGIGRLGSLDLLNLAEPSAELRNANQRGIGNIGSQRSRNGGIGAECTQVPLRTDLCSINILMLQIQTPYSMLTAGLHNHIDLGCIIVAGDNIQVGLGIAVHEVNVIAAISLFQIDIDHIGDGICSAIVPACHLTVECQEGLALYLILIVAELVGSADSRILYCCALYDSVGGFASLHLAGFDELSNILGAAAGIAAIDIADPGSGDGFICTVGTQEILTCGGQVYNVNAAIAVVYPVAGGLGGDLQAAALLTLIIGELFDLDIGLGLAIHKVEAQTLAVTLCIHIHTLAASSGGLQTVALNLTVEVHGIAGGLLIHIQPVGHAFLQGAVVHIPGALFPAIQVTLSAEFQLAVVVLNNTGNGDGIGLTDLIDTVADHTVALDLHTVYLNGNGHIAVIGIVSVIHADDLAGQSCTVGQLLTNAQLCSVSQDLGSIGGGLLCHTAAADALDHHTAGIILNGALVVLDNTGNSNQVVNGNLIHAGTLHAVAENGVLLVALDLNNNGDVAIVGIIGRIDLSNSTGQGCLIRQSLILLQSVSSLQDLTGVGGSVHCIALFNLLQNTAGIKLDGAFVILQNTQDGNDIADLQVLNYSNGVVIALHAVALDGHILCTLDLDGNSDILIFVAPNGVNGNDLTDQTGLVGQALAVCQGISSLDDLHHILSLGQDVVPAMGSCIAVFVGDGCSQHIRCCLFALLVDIDSNSAVLIYDDLYQILSNIHRPLDLELDTANTDNAVTVVVYGSFGAVVLIKTLQVIDGVLCAGTLNAGLLRSSGYRIRSGCRIFLRFTAGKHAQNHNQQKHPC